jgi:hypothetical protein
MAYTSASKSMSSISAGSLIVKLSVNSMLVAVRSEDAVELDVVESGMEVIKNGVEEVAIMIELLYSAEEMRLTE